MAYSLHGYEAGLAVGFEYSHVDDRDPITALDSDITHATTGDGFVDKFQPILVGSVPGVALTNSTAETDTVVVATGGIWSLLFDSDNGTSDVNITPGDPVYRSATGVLNQNTGGTLFGYAMATKTGSATPSNIPIKIAKV